MALFQDLPVEIHQMIVECCSDAGHHVLAKFSLLNRYFQSLARPLLTTSADLTSLKDEERKLQLFTHHFAPPLRTKLINLSLTLGRSQIFTEYSMEEGLDDIYSNIISLLPLLQTLHFSISSGFAKDELEQDDFALTFKSAARLKYLEAVTISGNMKDSSLFSNDSPSSKFIQQVIFHCLPRFKRLTKLNLTQLAIVLPHNLTEEYTKLEKLTHLHLQSVQLVDATSTNHISEDSFFQFINFFSTSVESLIIHDTKIDLPLHPCPIIAPRLYHLGISLATSIPHASSTYNHEEEITISQVEHEEQVYRRVLEYFCNAPALESIRILQPIVLHQFNLLNNSGGFKNVFRINQ